MYSIVDLSGTQGESNFNFSFGYLSEAHIHVYIDGVETEDFTFSGSFTITLDTALAANATVRIRRITPIDEPMVNWSNGSVLGESDLDTTVLQVLYAQQELDDENTDLITMQLANGGSFDAQGEKIINLATPTDPTDAVNKQYADALFAASVGSVPITALQDVDPASVLDVGTLMVGDGGSPTLLTSLARGNNGEILKVDTGEPTNLKWVTFISKLFEVLTTKGDLLAATGATVQRKAVGTDNQLLVADSTTGDGLAWKSLSTVVDAAGSTVPGLGLPRVTNLRGFWASNTSFTFSSTAVVLQNSSGLCVRVAGNTAGCDISVAGPTAGGRDQAGVFSASSFVHFYYIYNGTNLDLIASTAAPTHNTGPTLPNGYTYWCYITTLPVNSSTQLNKHNVMGNTVHRDPWDGMNSLLTKTTTGETSYSSAGILPTIALTVHLEWRLYCTDATAAQGDNVAFYFRAVSGGGSGWQMIIPVTIQPQVSNFQPYMNGLIIAPYLATYYAQLSDSGTITSRNLTMNNTAYTVPNNS